jgi:hypothetical protein
MRRVTGVKSPARQNSRTQNQLIFSISKDYNLKQHINVVHIVN